ncbi:DNA fragmentation factor subunit beta [Clupea harengus]|uniref:DNA fragmentation factor subunit beta n=1 Tax=Clupea harengus TaxID=7950 RepID=A0A6P3VLV5_CLUHA|nr:DNA fragmentation factor subunit beta [Clupea harengus]
MSRQQKTTKLVKIRSANEPRKFGVGATTLSELVEKSCQLLKIPPCGSRVCLYEDGTELTEVYFRSLAVNAELVLVGKGQHWNGFLSDIQRLLGLDRYSAQLIDEAKDFLSDELSAKHRKILGDLLFNLKDRSEIEDRAEDEDWFQGVDARFKTKSAYMKYNCENRVRGYLKEVDGYLRSVSSARHQAQYKKVQDRMTAKLKSAGYNGCYFSRTAKAAGRLCSTEGWFSCQGAYDEEECDMLHSINPYGNRESRILFSTWNLDHRIEKKRSVLPALVEALQSRKSSHVNVDYFYRLLFTVDNLKLVHIVCHKKGSHDLACDRRKIYKPVKRVRK